MNLNPVMNSIARMGGADNQENPADYGKDGLLYCGKCETPKQCMVSLFGETRTVPCLCKCEMERERAKREAAGTIKRMQAVSRLKSNGIQDPHIRDWTFEQDDGSNPAARNKALQYVEKWDWMYSENTGLLLWGNVGTGKTYLAACIANALIKQGIPTLMTNFLRLINALTGMYSEDKNAYIRELNHYKLLVIDDLGVERQSDYALEQVYNVIDSRCRNHQPLIVTTNIPVKEMQNQTDTRLRRIYDRILEMCVPIKFDGVSKRESIHHDKMRKAKDLLT